MRTLYFIILFFLTLNVSAQRFAYVNSEYILNKMPEYQSAQGQINKLTISWQNEIEEKYKEIDILFKKYQAEKILLTPEMINIRENEILNKENEAKELQRKRFGPQGELFTKTEELISPIQDKIFNAIEDFAKEKRYDVIFDQSSNISMLFSDKKLDKSDNIIKMLGL